jgi:hypothetical protein
VKGVGAAVADEATLTVESRAGQAAMKATPVETSPGFVKRTKQLLRDETGAVGSDVRRGYLNKKFRGRANVDLNEAISAEEGYTNGTYAHKFENELSQLGVPKAKSPFIVGRILSSFTDYKDIKISSIPRERSFWRRWGGGTARERGGFGSMGPRTPKYTRNMLAVKQNWNDLSSQTKFKIRKGGLLIEGRTRPQFDIDGTLLPGGGHQLYVPFFERDLY